VIVDRGLLQLVPGLVTSFLVKVLRLVEQEVVVDRRVVIIVSVREIVVEG
jgi:hypothetical protein